MNEVTIHVNGVRLMRLGVAVPDQLVDVSRLPYDQVEPTPAAACGSAPRCATATWPPIRWSVTSAATATPGGKPVRLLRWIRVLRSIRCIPIPRIHHEARINHFAKTSGVGCLRRPSVRVL